MIFSSLDNRFPTASVNFSADRFDFVLRLVYGFLSGAPPFYGDNNAAILEAVSEGNYSMTDTPGCQPTWSGVSAAAKKFVKSCLCVNVAKRYSAVEALQDAWLRTGYTSRTYSAALLCKVSSLMRKYESSTNKKLIHGHSSTENRLQYSKYNVTL